MAILENIDVILLLLVLVVIVPSVTARAISLQDLEKDECDEI